MNKAEEQMHKLDKAYAVFFAMLVADGSHSAAVSAAAIRSAAQALIAAGGNEEDFVEGARLAFRASQSAKGKTDLVRGRA